MPGDENLHGAINEGVVERDHHRWRREASLSHVGKKHHPDISGGDAEEMAEINAQFEAILVRLKYKSPRKPNLHEECKPQPREAETESALE